MSIKQFYGGVSGCARRALVRTWRTCRGLWAPAYYGFIVVFTLCVLTIALTYLGFAYQGSSNAPTQVPVPPSLSVSFAPGSAPPATLYIYTFLEQDSADTRLIVNATGSFARHQVWTNWTLEVRGFTGYLCPGQASLHLIPLVQQGADAYYIQGRSAVSVIGGTPFLAVGLCWNSGSPLVISSSYISAALSPVLAPIGQSGIVARSLMLNGSSLSSYTPGSRQSRCNGE